MIDGTTFARAGADSARRLGRRAVLSGAATAAATGLAAHVSARTPAAAQGEPATFVLVPGQWTGAFVWHKVTPLLREAGHDVYPMTCTGLGDRVHLANPAIDLDTHIMDVVNTIWYEDLHDVVLVGHSYAGMVITGVADRIPERLRLLVYLDADLPADGQNSYDFVPPEQGNDFLVEDITAGVDMGTLGYRPVFPAIEEWLRGSILSTFPATGGPNMHPRLDLDTFSQILGFDVSRHVLLRRIAGGGLAAAFTSVVLRGAPVAAQNSTPASEASGSPSAAGPLPAHHFQLGQIDLRVLDAGYFMAPASLPIINAPPLALAAALAKANLSAEGYPLPIHPLLVETGGQRILIDTGVGPITAFGAVDTLPAALAAEGIAPEEIDVVLFSHLHFDHASGAVDAAGKPAFPNARYLLGRTEYEFWWGEPGLVELPFPDELRQFFRETVKTQLLALQGTIEQIEPGDEVAPGVTVVDAAGHTPGHLAVEITSDGEGLLHVGDAASQTVLHLEHPDWFAGSDNWPAQSLIGRRMLLDRAAAEDLLVMTYHFPFPGLGRVTTEGDGWLWEPAA